MKRSYLTILGITLSVSALAATTSNVTLQCKAIGKANVQQCLYRVNGKKPASGNLYGYVNMPYALCSKSLCTIDPKNSKVANCPCSVPGIDGWTSASLAPNSYAKAQPTYDNNHQLKTVHSNYSMANITDFKDTSEINCQFSKPMPWANCFGVRCPVTATTENGVTAYTATCSCPITESETFVITGPGDQSKCNTAANQVWSGTKATKNGVYGGNPILFLYQKFYPTSPAAQ